MDKIEDRIPKDSYEQTPLHLAAENNHLEVCKLIKYLEDKSPRDYRGNTPLHLAAKEGHSDVYKLLYDHGVDESILNFDGKSADEIMVRKLTSRS